MHSIKREGLRNMKMIVGLGNPGRKYESTRHNIGFRVIDELMDRWNVTSMQSKMNGEFAVVHRPEGKVLLVKPMTYMNLSGECVRPLMDYYSIDPKDVIVLYDDLDLSLGRLRLRQRGSAGGHNGMKSLIQHIGTERFSRIRIGIDRPTNGMTIVDYVLASFRKEEEDEVIQVIQKAADACEDAVGRPFLEVMNTYNQQS